MRDSQSPTVSVIVPAYNAARTIGPTLRSVLDQTYESLELLVVDDASTDATRERVLEVAAGDPRVRYVRRASNGGRPAIPRNDAIRMARGELTAFLDSDDLWSPRKLEDQVTVMRRHPDLAFAYSIAWAFTDASTIGEHARALANGRRRLLPFPTRPSLTLEQLKQRNTIACSSVIARTSVLRDVGGFDEASEMRCLEDFDLWLRLAAAGPFAFVPRVHAYYRMHPTSSSNDPRGLNVAFLCAKHGLPMFAPSPHHSVLKATSRGLFSTMVMRALRLSEKADRTRGADVPARRVS